MNYSSFGKELRKIMIDNDSRLYDLAKALGVSSSFVSSVICGNKSDLNENRTVPIETVNSFLLGKKYINIETSAKENTNIDQMFDKIAEEIKKSKEIEDNNKIDIHSASTKSGNSSCNYCF